ncbi:MAG: xanthine dehydrogenase family protein subunit M [Nitrososphaerales archaeon]
MIPRSFEYLRPSTLQEAVQLLDKYEESKILAGGQSLIALMKLRLASPKYIIDITRIPGLSYVKEEGNKILIGPLTTHDTVENSPIIRNKCPILSEAASRIGDQQIRNRGTIAGTLCHADPSADVPTTFLALDGEVVAMGKDGERVIKAKDFFQDFFTTALNPNEVVKEVRVPVLPPKTGTAYIKHARREGDFAIVAVAAIITLDENNVCKSASISLGSVGPTPLRAVEVENALVGKKLTDEVIVAASELADRGISPPSDIHGSAEYRAEMAKVFTKRAIRLALSRIGG